MKLFKILLLCLTFVFCDAFNDHEVEVGTIIDTLNGVEVYFNGKDFTKVIGRHITKDGYNLGLKYQCVEFAKRYYYEVFHHKMPHTNGHAKDFFDQSLPDKAFNKKRGLMQYRNVREYQPMVNDILIYDGYPGNRFGHMAIISRVNENEIEIVQQNTGMKSRATIPLVRFYQYWTVADYNVLGWLRKE